MATAKSTHLGLLCELTAMEGVGLPVAITLNMRRAYKIVANYRFCSLGSHKVDFTTYSSPSIGLYHHTLTVLGFSFNNQSYM